MKKSTKGFFGFILGAAAGIAAYKVVKDKKAKQDEVIDDFEVEDDDFEECECEGTCDTCEETVEEACECAADVVEEACESTAEADETADAE